MDKATLTKNDLFAAVKARSNRQLLIGVIAFFGVFALMFSVAFASEFGFSGFLIGIQGVGTIIVILIALYCSGQNKIKNLINGKQYAILQKTIAHKEIDNSGDTTAFMIRTSDNKKYTVTKMDYQIAVIGQSYYLVAPQRGALLCIFAAQQYQLDDELQAQLKTV